MEPNEIVRALRCSKNENDNCATCKYAVSCKRPMLGGGWFDHCNTEALENDAADCIERLQAELATLRKELTAIAIESLEREKVLARLEAEVMVAADMQAELTRVTAERDAAVGDLREEVTESGSCCGCKHFDREQRRCLHEEYKYTCNAKVSDYWQWRGTDKEVW